MKQRGLLLFCWGALVAGAADLPAAKIPSANQRPTAADRFAVIKQRIDSLLAIRTDPPPFPSDSPNPFRLATDPVPGAAQPLAPVRTDLDRPLTDEELLPRLAAGLRFGGVVEMGDSKPRVIINQRNFREGDSIQITYQNKPLTLLVKSLTPERLILSLNTAETTIQLKKPR